MLIGNGEEYQLRSGTGTSSWTHYHGMELRLALTLPILLCSYMEQALQGCSKVEKIANKPPL
jgi:hypothetical protein